MIAVPRLNWRVVCYVTCLSALLSLAAAPATQPGGSSGSTKPDIDLSKD
jgi:hypothetical protein